MADRIWLLLGIGLVVGCHPEPCDPDQRYHLGVCFDVPPDASHVDASVIDAVDGPVDWSVFGMTCMSSSQCRPPSDVCAVAPNETVGFCTRLGCLEDPTICPPTWNCKDVGDIVPGLSVCVEP